MPYRWRTNDGGILIFETQFPVRRLIAIANNAIGAA
jgi:hypothetical protein